MKLALQPAELECLVDLLDCERRTLLGEMAHTESHDALRVLKKKEALISSLQDRAIACRFDFDADELDLLAEIVNKHDHLLCGEISRTDHHDYRRHLQDKQATAEHLLDRLIEACSMV